MQTLLDLVTTADLAFLIFGLIAPKKLPPVLNLIWSRKKVAITFFIVLVFIEFTSSSIDKSKPTTSAIPTLAISTNTPVPTKTITSPKPTEDPCHQYLGTPMMINCVNLQDAQTKGQALQKPLKAKVTYDSSAVYITNTETTEWDQCTATVNDDTTSTDNFQSEGFIVTPGQTQSIKWIDMTNAESVRFNYYHTKPYLIDLDCIVGGKSDASGVFTGGEEHRSLFNL